MHAYTQATPVGQPVLDTAKLPRVDNAGNDLASVNEEQAFRKRVDDRLTFADLTFQICLDYVLGCVDARTTIKRLEDNGLITTPDQLITLIAAGVGAYPYPRETPLPEPAEPSSAAMQPPSEGIVRVTAAAGERNRANGRAA